MSETVPKRRQMHEESETSDGLHPPSSSSSYSPSVKLPPIITNMDSRWKNWWIRGIFTFLMVGTFCVIIYLGPLCLTLLAMAIFLKSFQEIISIAHNKYKEFNIPLIRVLNWYFLLISAYFLFGDNIFFYYSDYVETHQGLLSILSKYHRIISFSVYVTGFVIFVLTLKKEHYQTQFGMFGWTHVTLFLLGTQVYFIIQNIFEGLYWFLLPVSLVVVNDISAYLCGFFFGRTSLIQLSPKKTWEGFIGAFVCTIIFGLVMAHFLSMYDYFVCYRAEPPCDRSSLYILQEYHIGSLKLFLYPALFHSLPFSIFASLIAPFGGFFASGFKRAFNIKDFADVIPGHGGIIDRFDCQMLMATFANVYYFTFLRSPNPSKLLGSLLALPLYQQQQVYEKLQDHLKQLGALE